MRTIVKGPEPPDLRAHRETAHGDYDNYRGKDGLREALVAEQRGLCCYCMGRIRATRDGMKIEHWRSRTRYPKKQLDYANLLGACLGGEGGRPKDQHCDTRKADSDLLWNPADPEARIRYGRDGSVRADDGKFNKQLDSVLNLNLPRLKNNRKSVLNAMLDWWSPRRKGMSKSRLEREVRRRTGGDGPLEPYVGVAVWWLERGIAKMGS